MKKLLCFILILLFILSGCTVAPQTEEWGSFSPDKTYSYDDKYYAIQSEDTDKNIVVNIYNAQNDAVVFSFTPARASDFWGVCWENDTYNIWIQSADVGILCYKYEADKWELDETAVRPDYIESKYDK